ncbi:MAG TPA: hypothetical protein VGC66_17810 [Pyrinomonadaceae bacterium]|jgi:hypothetical protein
MNLPFIYVLLVVHGRKGLSYLWGYAPNQFLFPMLVFPFASFSTFVCIYTLINRVGPKMPVGTLGRWFADNWIASMLLGISIVSLVCIAVYFRSAMSLDKLEPKYANRALDAIKQINTETARLSDKERKEFLDKMIKNAKSDAAILQPPPLDDTNAFDTWIFGLPPDVYLQIVQNPDLTLRLKLMNPPIHALNMLQILIGLFISFGALFSIFLCYLATKQLQFNGDNIPELREAINAAFFALFFFGFYPVFYHQQRIDIEMYVGGDNTVLQGFFSGVTITLLLVILRYLDPQNRDFSAGLLTLIRFSPAAIVVVGVLMQTFFPQLTRRLIGSGTDWGVQMIFVLLFIPLSSFWAYSIWPRH